MVTRAGSSWSMTNFRTPIFQILLHPLFFGLPNGARGVSLSLGARGNQIAHRFPLLYVRPLHRGVIPGRQNVQNIFCCPGVDEGLPDRGAHRVKIGIGDPEFSENPPSVVMVVISQRLGYLEFDSIALFRHGWR